MTSAMNPWRLATATMRIELDPHVVRSTTTVEAHRTRSGRDDLVLHGRGLTLEELVVDGVVVANHESMCDGDNLHIPISGDACVVTYTVTAPTGIPGQSGFVAQPRLLSTQCEPEGFRHITYFIDEPSNRTVFDVTLVADKNAYPMLLSNGDRVESGLADGGLHWARFVDPIPKPSYLFAMVAGDLVEASRTYRTDTGRNLTVKVVALPECIDGAEFALDTMCAAMKLDEITLHAEHDLDTLVLAAIPEYPDATEYHGLMIFEQAILVVDQRGFVDDDLMTIAANIAHEYGHQVRGNRVTVSTWSDLTVKEGLTVIAQNDFRAHQFGAVGRVLDVVDLRRLQFPEEVTIGAPVVQPEGGDPKRLYTRTTYLKGAEIFRMMRAVVGEDEWWAAMRAFYAEHDLGAVSVDNFVDALCNRNPHLEGTVRGIARWFRQPGRPHLAVSTQVRADGVDVRVERSDSLADAPPLVMPISLGFLSANGTPVHVSSADSRTGSEHTVILDSRAATYSFSGVDVAVVTPLRAYSAPVDITTDHSFEQYGIIAAHDPDPYTKWWAIEQLKIAAIDAHRKSDADGASFAVSRVAEALHLAVATANDSAYLAQLLAVPDEYALGDRDTTIDVDGVADGLEFLRASLGNEFAKECFALVTDIVSTDRGGTSAADIARRMPLEPLLALLLASDHKDESARVLSLCLNSTNDTIAMRAFAQVIHREDTDIGAVSAQMYERWKHAPRLVDRWIRARAGSRRADTVEWVAQFVESPLYDRNDRARVTAVWFPFCTRNRTAFHAPSGRGYEVFADELAHLMPTNSGLAVRFVGDLLQFQRFDEHRRELMRAQLERMTSMEGMPEFAVAILNSLLGKA